MSVKGTPCGSHLLGVLMEQFNKLQADVAALRSWAINHVHTENTAATYTQNASTAAPTTAPPAMTSDTVQRL